MSQAESSLPSAFSLFKPSIEALQRNLLQYFLLLVLPTLLLTVDSDAESDPPAGFQLYFLFGGLVTLLVYPALVYVYLQAANKKTASLKTAFSKGYSKFWTLLGLTLLVGIIVIAGLIALVVPGVIFLRRYMLSPFYVMDRNVGISEAMRLSAEESKRYSGAIYGVIGVSILIALVSIFGLPGIILSTILSILYATAPAIRYLEIKRAIN